LKELFVGHILAEGHAADFFFTPWCVVYHKFVPVEQTVNSSFYVEGLKHLRYAICWKRLENGEIIGSYTMTILLITPPSQLSCFW
jgi:hypothetical protein